MKIRMKTVSAGPEGNRFPGVEYEVSEKEGGDLVRGGYAVAVQDDPPPAKMEEAVASVERAVEPPKEKAVAPEGRPAARRRR